MPQKTIKSDRYGDSLSVEKIPYVNLKQKHGDDGIEFVLPIDPGGYLI